MPRSLRLLHIEDSEDDAAILLRELQRGGYEPHVIRVSTPGAMHAALRDHTWDLVIADWNLPQFSALFALEQLQCAELDLPFIIVSGVVGEEAAVEAMKAGAHDYVMKDNLKRLVPVIEREVREADARRERRKTEAALHESEQRLELAIEGAEIGIWDITIPTGRIVYDRRWEGMLGYTVEELEPHLTAWERLVHPDDLPRMLEVWNAHANRKSPFYESEFRLRTKSGGWNWVFARGKVIERDSTDAPLRASGTYLDITARKRAEEVRVRLASIVESSEDAIISTTVEGIVTSWNRGAERTFGYTAAEVIGQPIGILIPQERLDEAAQILERVKQGARVTHFETVRRRKDGKELTIALTLSPIEDGAGLLIGFSQIARDITEQKSLEAQLRQSQKMEGVGQLAGGIAHDFNNLLTVINSYSAMVLDELDGSNPFARKGLEQIKEAGFRAASLTRQLLMFSRQQVLEPKVLDLNEVVSNTAKLLRRLIGEDITQVLCLHPSLGRVKIDSGQLEQVIINLAVNARDAMPSGGQLTIETNNVELDQAYTRTHALVEPGPYVMLAVSDTGCGMDAVTQARIFEPFFTTKGVGKGTGLGLATVDGIVTQSGGSLWVSSEVGTGTTLRIYLPRIEQTSEVPESGAAPAELLRGSETVLLVEDEDMVRALAQAILERCGYHVLAAGNGQDALRLAQERQEPIHLLLTDTIMPVMNGPELAKQLRALRPETKVLFMSGYTDKVIAYTAALEPGTAFLQKPFTPHTLTQKVQEVLSAVPQPQSTARAA